MNFFNFNVDTTRDYLDIKLTEIILKLCNFPFNLLHQSNTFFFPMLISSKRVRVLGFVIALSSQAILAPLDCTC